MDYFGAAVGAKSDCGPFVHIKICTCEMFGIIAGVRVGCPDVPGHILCYFSWVGIFRTENSV